MSAAAYKAAHVRIMRRFGWLVIVMVPVVVLVGNWITHVMDPQRCPVGITCIHSVPQ